LEALDKEMAAIQENTVETSSEDSVEVVVKPIQQERKKPIKRQSLVWMEILKISDKPRTSLTSIDLRLAGLEGQKL
jgi:hypothetical protein